MDVQCGEFLIAFLARFSLHHLAHFNCATIIMRDVDPHRTLRAVQEYLVIHGGVAQPVQFLTALSALNLFRIQPIVCLDLISHSRWASDVSFCDSRMNPRLAKNLDYTQNPAKGESQSSGFDHSSSVLQSTKYGPIPEVAGRSAGTTNKAMRRGNLNIFPKQTLGVLP
jgi:hypothetical protein